jgi:F0F1-type ATP synthase assembly protein I
LPDNEPEPDSPKPEPPSGDEYLKLAEQARKLRDVSSHGERQNARFGVDKSVNVWLRYTTVGLQFVLVMLAPMGLGYWLDVTFDLLPWLTLTGFALGATAAMTSLIREVMRMGAKEDAERKKRES